MLTSLLLAASCSTYQEDAARACRCAGAGGGTARASCAAAPADSREVVGEQ